MIDEQVRRPRPRTETHPETLVGARVRVVARRGAVVEGICLDAWRLRNGGTALKVRPGDGSAPREVTTLLPVAVVDEERASDS